jgi:predicted amidophosphoribosyltransferase
MISSGTFPHRLTKIDDLSRPDHSYLSAADDCYFLGEYTARKGYAFSSTNQLILNLKKGMDRRDRPGEWAYKGRAIRTAAEALRASVNDAARGMLTFVPIPPSKAKGDAFYDDRLLQVLQGVWPGQATDIRELILQPASADAVHDREERPRPAELEARYAIDRGLLQPAPQMIAVLDDVITTGAHFVAARNLLQREFPDTKIVGLFIARRVPEAVDIEDFDTH